MGLRVEGVGLGGGGWGWGVPTSPLSSPRIAEGGVAPGNTPGFRVQGLGFRVQGAGCRVQGSGFRV